MGAERGGVPLRGWTSGRRQDPGEGDRKRGDERRGRRRVAGRGLEGGWEQVWVALVREERRSKGAGARESEEEEEMRGRQSTSAEMRDEE